MTGCVRTRTLGTTSKRGHLDRVNRIAFNTKNSNAALLSRNQSAKTRLTQGLQETQAQVPI